MIIKKEEGKKPMANIINISRATLPVNTSAGRNVPPGVRIAETGTIRLNHKASQLLYNGFTGNPSEVKGLFIDQNFDVDVRKLTLSLKPFKGQPSGEKDIWPVSISKKDNSISFGATSLLRAIDYDFDGSGAQIFLVTGTKDHTVSFQVPLGTIAKRELKPRKPRKAKVTTPATLVTPVETLEPELVEA